VADALTAAIAATAATPVLPLARLTPMRCAGGKGRVRSYGSVRV
jgi:hypothetical protein